MTPTRADFRFFDRLRVRWAEVDLQKIVFNGHYLMYFDTAVSAYWRALAMPYHETMAQLQGDIFVRKATLEYLASARYDDLLDVGMRCARIGTSSMTFQAATFRGEQCLVHGELVYVFADPATQTSRPVPPLLREWLSGFEAGQPVGDLQVGRGADMAKSAVPLRLAVFGEEMGLPAAVIQSDAETLADATATHALIVNRAGLTVAAGRLVTLDPTRVQIGRMVVLQALRGGGLGRQVLTALLTAARQAGAEDAVLNAAAGAVPFYERAGFQKTGVTFEEAGTVHHEMQRSV